MSLALAERLPPETVIPDSLAAGERLEHESNEIDHSRFELAVRLAALLSRPTEYIDDANCKLESFEPAQVKAIASHPAFQAPINRAVAESMGFTKIKIDKEMMARLSSSPASRLAAVITTATMTEVQQVAWTMAAIVLSKRIRALVLRNDRDIVREALGTDAFDIATHEAQVLHPALCDLDAKSAKQPIFSQESDDEARRAQILQFGLQILGRFLDATEPVLGDLFALRVPPSINYSGRNQVVKAFDQIHRDQFLKLIRRRQQSWAAIIG